MSSVRNTGGMRLLVFGVLLEMELFVRVCTVIIAESYFFFPEHARQRMRINTIRARVPTIQPTTIAATGSDELEASPVGDKLGKGVGEVVVVSSSSDRAVKV
jgi:hypothetical protein